MAFKIPFLRLLVEKGADVMDSDNAWGRHALPFAAAAGPVEAIRAVLAAAVVSHRPSAGRPVARNNTARDHSR